MVYETERDPSLDGGAGKHPGVTVLQDDLDALQKAGSIGADYQGLIEIISMGNV